MTWEHPTYLQETTGVRPADACPHCSGPYSWIIHNGACPKVAEIEYHQNGTVKRVKFHPEVL